MAKAHFLKDQKGNKFYPYGHAAVTFDENGNSVQNRLDGITHNGIFKSYVLPNDVKSTTIFQITDHTNYNESIHLRIYARYYSMELLITLLENDDMRVIDGNVIGTKPEYTVGANRTIIFTSFQSWSAQYIELITPFLPNIELLISKM